MNIQKLSEAEKELAVSEIVRKGVVTPGSRLKKIIEIKRICTFRTLFFGVGDCLFLGILTAACLWMLFIQAGMQVIVCMTFAISPFAYMASYLLTVWKEHLLQLYDVKMTCRYTIRQVSAFRMIYFGGINLFLNVLMLAWLMKFRVPAVTFGKLLGLSFGAIFLYGVMMLGFQIKGNSCEAAVLPPVLWGLLNGMVIIFYGKKLEQILLNLAEGLVFMIAVVIFVIYLITLCAYLFSKAGEGRDYAVG